jgi:hypothetical protein
MAVVWSNLYGFQKIVETSIQNLSAGENSLISIASKDIAGRLFTLAYTRMTVNANVTLRLKVDAYPTVDSRTYNESEPFIRLLRTFRANAVASAAVSNYSIAASFYVSPLRIADKILLGLSLTDEEKAIADELALQDGVEKGFLPLPPADFAARAFKTKYKTRVVRSDSAASIPLLASVNELVALTSLYIPSGASVGIKIDDKEIASIDGRAVGGVISGSPIALFLVGSKLELAFVSGIGAVEWFYEYAIIRDTDYLKMLYERMAKSEDEELWKKVVAGVL